jgi:hypothetical protein
MQNYRFILHNGCGVEELGAMALPSGHEALAFARQIVADLVQEAAGPYADWAIEVRIDERKVGRIPFPPP